MSTEKKDEQAAKSAKDDEIAELKEAFAVFDKNGDGTITAVELGKKMLCVQAKPVLVTCSPRFGTCLSGLYFLAN